MRLLTRTSFIFASMIWALTHSITAAAAENATDSSDEKQLPWLHTYLVNQINFNEYLVYHQKEKMEMAEFLRKEKENQKRQKSSRKNKNKKDADVRKEFSASLRLRDLRVQAAFASTTAISNQQFLGSNLSRQVLAADAGIAKDGSIPAADLKLLTEPQAFATYQSQTSAHAAGNASSTSQQLFTPQIKIEQLKVPQQLDAFATEYSKSTGNCDKRPSSSFDLSNHAEKLCLLTWEYLFVLPMDSVDANLLQNAKLDEDFATTKDAKILLTLIALKNEIYPEALSYLHSLSASDRRFRDLYDSTQKIYAARVKTNRGVYLDALK